MAVTDKQTFAEIQAQRHKEMHEREQQATAWAAEVTEQLINQRSTFLQDFTEEQKRLFGVLE